MHRQEIRELYEELAPGILISTGIVCPTWENLKFDWTPATSFVAQVKKPKSTNLDPDQTITRA